MTAVVKVLWEAMKEKVWEILKGKELALASDGKSMGIMIHQGTVLSIMYIP